MAVNFCLDWDGTYTADPELWLAWIVNAHARGHRVYVITMRYPSEVPDNAHTHALAALGVHIVATSRLAKRPFARAMGIDIHIWIDDNPEAVLMDADQIWSTPAPEGHPVDPKHDNGSPLVSGR